MKGGVGGGVGPVKRRWKGLAIGVFFLVFLSMLVPLAFLFGLGFRSPGIVPLQQTPASSGIRNHDRYVTRTAPNQSERSRSHIYDLLRKLGPILPKDVRRNISNEVKNETISGNATCNNQPEKGTPVPSNVVVQPLSNRNVLMDLVVC